ncbi:class I SAM-dependent methyltransferase [Protofrankia symbiont of Coriaria ruscifolia]|uniref:class I SAM-dependent methyltransferase n=1 Tax=Protofrankia symbiont of Coriaria ruscifolia TaxID=1306542 RepID=UPI00104100B0|nr:class I SAM-dependent methyltransferase [Protofrankia symbiont of Coriaria ruscifolia]
MSRPTAGRIALPPVATGTRVDGVDLSPAMVAKLRAKPTGENVNITMGDFADVPVEDIYRLIFIVFNTMFHDVPPVDPGRPGPLLRERGPPPHRRRAVRRGSIRPDLPDPAARRPLSPSDSTRATWCCTR